MPQSTPILTGFGGGLLSPLMAGRADLPVYAQGCEELKNFIVMPHGGVYSRQGTQYITSTKNDEPVKLVPFVFSEEDAYVLEMGSGYIRFFADRGLVIGGTGSGLETNSAFASAGAWTRGSGMTIAGGQLVLAGGSAVASCVQSMAVSAGESYYITFDVVSAAGSGTVRGVIGSGAGEDWAIGPGGEGAYEGLLVADSDGALAGLQADHGFTGKVDNVSVRKAGIYEVSSPYHQSQLENIKFAQVADETRFAQEDIIPQLLTRNGHALWTMSAHTFSAEVAHWSENNYPAGIGFYEQRLAFCGTKTKPQTTDWSVSGDWEDFTTTGSDWETGLEFTIAAPDVNRANWMCQHGDRMFLGTLGSLWSAYSNNASEPLGPNSVKFFKEHSPGVASIQGQQIQTSLIAVSRHRNKLQSFDYSDDAGRYVPTNLLLFAEHLGRESKISGFVYADDPYKLIWCWRDDGTVIALTYQPDRDVIAWHEHPTQGAVEQMCVIPGADSDDVYMVVRREVDGATRRYVEVLAPHFDHATPIEDAVCLDCSLTFHESRVVSNITAADPAVVEIASHGFSDGDYVWFSGLEGNFGSALNGQDWLISGVTSGTFQLVDLDASGFPAFTSGALEQSVNQVSGLDHLEGWEVGITGDGTDAGTATVTSGAITLGDRYHKVHVGLPYKPRLKTMNLELAAQAGTSQGKQKHIGNVTARFYRTVGARVGTSNDHMQDIQFREVTDIPGEAIPPKTGDYTEAIIDAWGKDGQIIIEQAAPLPITVLAIMPTGEVNE